MKGLRRLIQRELTSIKKVLDAYEPRVREILEPKVTASVQTSRRPLSLAAINTLTLDVLQAESTTQQSLFAEEDISSVSSTVSRKKAPQTKKSTPISIDEKGENNQLVSQSLFEEKNEAVSPSSSFVTEGSTPTEITTPPVKLTRRTQKGEKRRAAQERDFLISDREASEEEDYLYEQQEIAAQEDFAQDQADAAMLPPRIAEQKARLRQKIRKKKSLVIVPHEGVVDHPISRLAVEIQPEQAIVIPEPVPQYVTATGRSLRGVLGDRTLATLNQQHFEKGYKSSQGDNKKFNVDAKIKKKQLDQELHDRIHGDPTIDKNLKEEMKNILNEHERPIPAEDYKHRESVLDIEEKYKEDPSIVGKISSLFNKITGQRGLLLEAIKGGYDLTASTINKLKEVFKNKAGMLKFVWLDPHVSLKEAYETLSPEMKGVIEKEADGQSVIEYMNTPDGEWAKLITEGVEGLRVAKENEELDELNISSDPFDVLAKLMHDLGKEGYNIRDGIRIKFDKSKAKDSQYPGFSAIMGNFIHDPVILSNAYSILKTGDDAAIRDVLEYMATEAMINPKQSLPINRSRPELVKTMILNLAIKAEKLIDTGLTFSELNERSLFYYGTAESRTLEIDTTIPVNDFEENIGETNAAFINLVRQTIGKTSTTLSGLLVDGANMLHTFNEMKKAMENESYNRLIQLNYELVEALREENSITIKEAEHKVDYLLKNFTRNLDSINLSDKQRKILKDMLTVVTDLSTRYNKFVGPTHTGPLFGFYATQNINPLTLQKLLSDAVKIGKTFEEAKNDIADLMLQGLDIPYTTYLHYKDQLQKLKMKVVKSKGATKKTKQNHIIEFKLLALDLKRYGLLHKFIPEDFGHVVVDNIPPNYMQTFNPDEHNIKVQDNSYYRLVEFGRKDMIKIINNYISQKGKKVNITPANTKTMISRVLHYKNFTDVVELNKVLGFKTRTYDMLLDSVQRQINAIFNVKYGTINGNQSVTKLIRDLKPSVLGYTGTQKGLNLGVVGLTLLYHKLDMMADYLYGHSKIQPALNNNKYFAMAEDLFFSTALGGNMIVSGGNDFLHTLFAGGLLSKRMWKNATTYVNGILNQFTPGEISAVFSVMMDLTNAPRPEDTFIKGRTSIGNRLLSLGSIAHLGETVNMLIINRVLGTELIIGLSKEVQEELEICVNRPMDSVWEVFKKQPFEYIDPKSGNLILMHKLAEDHPDEYLLLSAALQIKVSITIPTTNIHTRGLITAIDKLPYPLNVYMKGMLLFKGPIITELFNSFAIGGSGRTTAKKTQMFLQFIGVAILLNWLKAKSKGESVDDEHIMKFIINGILTSPIFGVLGSSLQALARGDVTEVFSGQFTHPLLPAIKAILALGSGIVRGEVLKGLSVALKHANAYSVIKNIPVLTYYWNHEFLASLYDYLYPKNRYIVSRETYAKREGLTYT